MLAIFQPKEKLMPHKESEHRRPQLEEVLIGIFTSLIREIKAKNNQYIPQKPSSGTNVDSNV